MSKAIRPATHPDSWRLFFHCSEDILLLDKEASAKCALETASCWLSQCRDILGLISDQYSEEINDSLYGAITLLELAKGVIDAPWVECASELAPNGLPCNTQQSDGSGKGGQ